MSPEQLGALSRVDLNLLRSLDALLSERSVTLAAARLSVGQPAMSASLGRLRRLFDDPLLVRDGALLVPTPVAEALGGPIAAALVELSATMSARRSFDPLFDEWTFTVISSDHMTMVMLKNLLNTLREEAPGVHLNVLPMVADFVGQVRRDEVDLVIAPRVEGEPPAGVSTCDLLTDRLVCAVALDHPEIGREITRDQFSRSPRLTFDDGGPLAAALRRQLLDAGLPADFDVRAQSYVVAGLMLEGTDMIGVVPSLLAGLLTRRGGVRIAEPPVDLARLVETLYWSPLNDADPAHVWLRGRLLRAASGLS